MKTPKKHITKVPPTRTLQNKEKGANKLRVAGYARVSTDTEEQQNSYEAQLDYYKKMIAGKRNWDFAGMYSDEGLSGTVAKNRPGFQSMLDDAFSGKIDLIVTKSISRFARNTVDSLSAIRELKSHRVEIFFEKENIWTFDSKGELMITILSSLAQEESRSISENVRWGIRKSFADGKVSFCRHRPYGYLKNPDGSISIQEKEADIVRFIFHRFIEGYSIRAIRSVLENEGVSAPRGGTKWSYSTILGILQNERYYGDAILQKTYTLDFLDKKRKKNNGELTKWIVEGNHPAIISKVAFEVASKAYSSRKERPYCGWNQLSGKVICGLCGRPMKQKLICNETKYQKRIWYCPGHIRISNQKLIELLDQRIDAEIKDCIKRLSESDITNIFKTKPLCKKIHARFNTITDLSKSIRIPIGLIMFTFEKISVDIDEVRPLLINSAILR